MAAEQLVESDDSLKESNACKVFVGNLAYQVDDEKLTEHFSQAGKVVSAKVILRYGRSAGYGFVTFESEGDVDQAVELKDMELEGRKVNVERAAPKSETDAPRRSRGRGRARGHGPRRDRPAPTGEPSKTTLFVGNLPFNVIDDDLLNIFSNFKIEKAHVVRRFNGASRGFAFVTLSNPDEQSAALEQLADVWCDDRKLIVRAALSDAAHEKAEQDVAGEPSVGQ